MNYILKFRCNTMTAGIIEEYVKSLKFVDHVYLEKVKVKKE